MKLLLSKRKQAEWYLRKSLFYSYCLKEHIFDYLMELPDLDDSNKYLSHMFLVFNTIVLHNFWLIVISWAQALYM